MRGALRDARKRCPPNSKLYDTSNCGISATIDKETSLGINDSL